LAFIIKIYHEARLSGRQKECQRDIIESKITKWKERSGNRADWEKCIKEGKVRTGQNVVPSKMKINGSTVESTGGSIVHC